MFITVIGPRTDYRTMELAQAVTVCEETFIEMANDGKKLSIAQNPMGIVIFPFFLVNRNEPGPATIFTGDINAISALSKAIGRLMLEPRFAAISDYI